MSKEYYQMEIHGEPIHVMKESVEKLKNTTAVIFDCDGVLIDVRESYNKTTSKTVSFFLKELTGNLDNLVLNEIIHLFKKSGGFNNDWDLTYTILLGIFSNLPTEFHDIFEKYVALNHSETDFVKLLLAVKKGIRNEFPIRDVTHDEASIVDSSKQLAKTADASGIASIERTLKHNSRVTNFDQFSKAMKRFFSYPGRAGESLLTTVFEEIFCGPQLFRKMYKEPPRFYNARGLIENELVIIQNKTLDEMTQMFKNPNFGIASGRQYHLAKYTLKELINRFNSKALVFLDDIELAEREARVQEGEDVNLKKPNPFSLFKATEGLTPFKFALYVGDSVEDVLVVKEANKLDPRFLFVGVTNHSLYKSEIFDNFIKADADVILPSVNYLTKFLESVKEG